MSRKSINRFGTLIVAFVLLGVISTSVASAAAENTLSVIRSVSSAVGMCNQFCKTQLAQIKQVDTKHYYYNQLNEMERLIYRNFMDSKNKFVNNESFSFVIKTFSSENEKKPSLAEYNRAVNKARSAFLYDNPEVAIWCQNMKLALNRGSPLSHILICKPNSHKTNYWDFDSEEKLLTELEDFEKCAMDFVSTLEGTDAQKLLKIYNWLIEDGEYDDDLTLANNTQNAYGAIINKKAVCSGFSFAFKYVADLAGLKVLYVTGWVVDDGKVSPVYHAWNMAYVDNHWCVIDVTGGVSNKNDTKSRGKFFMNFDYQSLYQFDKRYFVYSDF